MSSETNISFPIAALEELRCYVCKHYLSCGPVRLLSNENWICGRCTPPISDALVRRLVAFEPFLSKLSFPCIFKKHGCTEIILFGKTADHESNCAYKLLACSANTFSTCSWEGMATQFLEHFNDKHPEFLKDEAEFKLEINEDAQGLLMVVENSLAFIIKYVYKASDGNLKYDIRFCANNNEYDVSFKIQLVNSLDAESNLNLKTSECCSYNESFCDMQNAKVFNLKKLLEYLDHPDCIVVAIKPKVVKADYSNDPTEGEVNFHLIKSLRCHECQHYLVPPLFELDGNAICGDCVKKDNSNCKPSNDVDLLKRVNEATYPCRWRDCNFICKSRNFKEHQISCPFRLHSCVYDDCDDKFKLNDAANHFQTHNAVYVTGDIVYQTSFARNYEGTDIITIKYEGIYLIAHKMYRIGPPYMHSVQMFTNGEIDFSKIKGIVVFEHDHCKIKSKEFVVNVGNPLYVAFKDLPSCFKKEDELSVTVEIISE